MVSERSGVLFFAPLPQSFDDSEFETSQPESEELSIPIAPQTDESEDSRLNFMTKPDGRGIVDETQVT